MSILHESHARHRAPRVHGRRTTTVVLLAIVALVAAEWVLAQLDPSLGAAAHAVILLVLLLRWVWAGEEAILVLAIIPMARIASLALTPKHSGLTAYVVTALPAAIPVVWAMRNSPATSARRRTRVTWHAVVVMLTGLLAGLTAHLFLDLPRLPNAHSLRVVTVGAVVVFLCAGVVEELLFRGLLQGALEGQFGGWAIVLADVVFAAMYLPTRDTAALAALAAFGLFWGWYVRRTGGLAAVAIAHGLMAAGALVVWPGIT